MSTFKISFACFDAACFEYVDNEPKLQVYIELYSVSISTMRIFSILDEASVFFSFFKLPKSMLLGSKHTIPALVIMNG